MIDHDDSDHLIQIFSGSQGVIVTVLNQKQRNLDGSESEPEVLLFFFHCRVQATLTQ
jgi:hypothetical protein